MDTPFAPPDGIDSECHHAEDDSMISNDLGFYLEMLNGKPFPDLEPFCDTTQDIDGGHSGQDNMLIDLENDFSDLFNAGDATLDVSAFLDWHVVIQDADHGARADENPSKNSNKTKNPLQMMPKPEGDGKRFFCT
jgi:hypothetical protein